MRFIFMGNNLVAARAAQWLASSGHQPVGLVLSSPQNRRHADEIIAAFGIDADDVIDGGTLNETDTIERIRSLSPDLGLSMMFDQMLHPPILDVFPKGVVNLHPSFLPYNRGAYPNVWSIIDDTPAGVTLHYMDEGLDTGDLIAQMEVKVEPVDTGATLYAKLEQAMLDLLEIEWPRIVLSQIERRSQDHSLSTSHRVRDVEQVDRIDLDAHVRAGDLVDILRARTFPPYSGAYFVHEGRRVQVTVNLAYVDE